MRLWGADRGGDYGLLQVLGRVRLLFLMGRSGHGTATAIIRLQDLLHVLSLKCRVILLSLIRCCASLLLAG